ncbi:MAG TPA: amidase family protein, partial [Methylomirabilota bacterium]|nr:amidase family protein [Methylomirabilota bacterium]
MSELCWTSMTELARMIASKKVSPVEVVRAHLDRIAALDGKLKSYITVLADAALAAARVAETAVMSGATLGPLHGVPVGLK